MGPATRHADSIRERSSAGEPAESSLTLSEVVSALSFALDLTEDAVPGHALRSCLLGMRIGTALGLPDAQLHDLYYALLLKDIGCSSNSARICQVLGGDDRTAKAAVKTVDWTRPTLKVFKMAWRNALPGAGALRKAQRVIRLARDRERNNAEMIGLRCERGADIVQKIGLGCACADAIYALDEHWNGSGYPGHLRGESIPLLARILGVAQHLDVFAGAESRSAAISTLVQRQGSWFDPQLVRVVLSLDREGALWNGCHTAEERSRVLSLEPGQIRIADSLQIDRICEAFADVIDAKSPFTYRHSIGVMEAANGIARQLNLSPWRQRQIHRAALLHDLGKLSISNTILDKPEKLNDAEWLIVRGHPQLSRSILDRIRTFHEVAIIAGNHHERWDGTGYPNQLSGDQLTLEDRIVSMADIYGALAEDRPYRAGLEPEQILAILRRDLSTRLDDYCFDVDCFDALRVHMEEIHARPRVQTAEPRPSPPAAEDSRPPRLRPAFA